MHDRSNQASNSSTPFELLLEEYVMKNDALLQSLASSIQNVEMQADNITGELKNRPKGTLPNNIDRC